MLRLDPALLLRMRQLGLDERDFVEIFARAGGPGGQHVNKVSTAVTLRERRSGIQVTAQEFRSQLANRRTAAERLVTLLEQKRADAQAKQRSAAEKARRRRSPRPRSLKREIRRTKERRADLKRQRTRVVSE
jgi:ribosome-associated protein